MYFKLLIILVSNLNMFAKGYSNFVKASFLQHCSDVTHNRAALSGEEAQKLYLEEVKNAKVIAANSTKRVCALENRRKIVNEEEQLSNKDLFLTVQNNDIDRLKYVLDRCPDKINLVDDYGWSLLMIACQANSVDAVKELLKRGIDMSVRDKAGNSASSLVIKNKNYILADVLLSFKQKVTPTNSKQSKLKVKFKEEFTCDICNKTFPDREEHLSSTLHNISASKGKKIPPNYVIPETNRGFQLMLKVGWDKESGLGIDGSGKRYPIKTVHKKDRKGLGHDKRKINEKQMENDNVKHRNRKRLVSENQRSKSFEINFRRQFY